MRNNFGICMSLIAYFMGHTYTKNVFVVYLKFNLTGNPVFLFAKFSNVKVDAIKKKKKCKNKKGTGLQLGGRGRRVCWAGVGSGQIK